jgi:allantoin racemase
MAITIINPNSTISMTDAMVAAARAAAPGAGFVGVTSHNGPPSIQGGADGAAALPHFLKLAQAASDAGASAIIIGCFDDTGLAEARALSACPVIGIGQAGYHLAALAGARFSVVTTLAVSVPILAANIAAYGLSEQLGQVRASGVPVLALECDADDAAERVIAEIQRAAHEDGVQSVVLGCGGMVDIPRRAAGRTPVRIIDGVAAAARFAAMLS